MIKSQKENIVALPEQKTVPPLNVPAVEAMRAKAIRRRELAAVQVRTREIDAEQAALTRELSDFVSCYDVQLLDTFMVMFTEYRPFLMALQPLMARAGVFQVMPPKPKEEPAK